MQLSETLLDFETASLTDPSGAQLYSATRDDLTVRRAQTWVNTQIRLIEGWINCLIADDGDVMLIGLLDQHLAFLKQAHARLTFGVEIEQSQPAH